jgi:hypothetical protein
MRCAGECEYCAEACRRESDDFDLGPCARRSQDCAQFCRTAAEFMNRESLHAADACRLCGEICQACARECERHEHEHCQRCARRCRECADECHRAAIVLAQHASY